MFSLMSRPCCLLMNAVLILKDVYGKHTFLPKCRRLLSHTKVEEMVPFFGSHCARAIFYHSTQACISSIFHSRDSRNLGSCPIQPIHSGSRTCKIDPKTELQIAYCYPEALLITWPTHMYFVCYIYYTLYSYNKVV